MICCIKDQFHILTCQCRIHEIHMFLNPSVKQFFKPSFRHRMSSTCHWVDRATDEFLVWMCGVFFIFFFSLFVCFFLIIIFQIGIPFFQLLKMLRRPKPLPEFFIYTSIVICIHKSVRFYKTNCSRLSLAFEVTRKTLSKSSSFIHRL